MLDVKSKQSNFKNAKIKLMTSIVLLYKHISTFKLVILPFFKRKNTRIFIFSNVSMLSMTRNSKSSTAGG